MRIISACVKIVDSKVKIYLETIKKKSDPKPSVYNFGLKKLNKKESLSWDGYAVSATNFQFQAYLQSGDDAPITFVNNHYIITLPDDSLSAIHLLERIDRFFKIKSYDHILLTNEFIKNLVPGLPREEKAFYQESSNTNPKVYTFDMTIREYIANKSKLEPPAKLNEYLINEIIKLAPTFKILEILRLLNPLVDQSVKDDIIKRIIDNGHPEKLMSNFIYYAKNALIETCYGKKAHDRGTYSYGYTELSLLREAEFGLRDDGRMSINLQNNNIYMRLYAIGKRNHGILSDELKHLGNIIGLEFAPDADFDKEIIFTAESTKLLKQKGLHYNDEYLNQLVKREKSNVTENYAPQNSELDKSSDFKVRSANSTAIINQQLSANKQQEREVVNSQSPLKDELHMYYDPARKMLYFGDPPPINTVVAPEVKTEDENHTRFIQ